MREAPVIVLGECWEYGLSKGQGFCMCLHVEIHVLGGGVDMCRSDPESHLFNSGTEALQFECLLAFSVPV